MSSGTWLIYPVVYESVVRKFNCARVRSWPTPVSGVTFTSVSFGGYQILKLNLSAAISDPHGRLSTCRPQSLSVRDVAALTNEWIDFSRESLVAFSSFALRRCRSIFCHVTVALHEFEQIECAQHTDDLLLVRHHHPMYLMVAHHPCSNTGVVILRDRIDLLGHDLADWRARLQLPDQVSR